MCPVQAMLRIWSRAHRLKLSPSDPLAVGERHGAILFLTEALINAHIKSAAKAVYNITNPSDLKRYTSHSARVGAAVHLHLAGKDATFIKTRLRWRSDTFLLYLRNVIELAEQHVTALARTPFS